MKEKNLSGLYLPFDSRLSIPRASLPQINVRGFHLGKDLYGGVKIDAVGHI